MSGLSPLNTSGKNPNQPTARQESKTSQNYEWMRVNVWVKTSQITMRFPHCCTEECRLWASPWDKYNTSSKRIWKNWHKIDKNWFEKIWQNFLDSSSHRECIDTLHNIIKKCSKWIWQIFKNWKKVLKKIWQTFLDSLSHLECIDTLHDIYISFQNCGTFCGFWSFLNSETFGGFVLISVIAIWFLWSRNKTQRAVYNGNNFLFARKMKNSYHERKNTAIS